MDYSFILVYVVQHCFILPSRLKKSMKVRLSLMIYILTPNCSTVTAQKFEYMGEMEFHVLIPQLFLVSHCFIVKNSDLHLLSEVFEHLQLK